MRSIRQIQHFMQAQDEVYFSALANGDLPVIEDCLIYRNTDPNQLLLYPTSPIDFKAAPALCIAVANDNEALVNLLLKHKADPNVCDDEGITPLMLAADTGNRKIINALIEHGANLTAHDDEGRYVVDYAEDEATLYYLTNCRLNQLYAKHNINLDKLIRAKENTRA